jgi:hypothetical protein
MALVEPKPNHEMTRRLRIPIVTFWNVTCLAV